MINKRRWVFGLGPVTIKARSTKTISVATGGAQFRGNKLVVTVDDIHRTGLRRFFFKLWCKILDFLSIVRIESRPGIFIHRIIVDDRDQLPSKNPISSLSFAPDIAEAIEFSNCEAGRTISLVVENVTGDDHVFAAALFGSIAIDDGDAQIAKLREQAKAST